MAPRNLFFGGGSAGSTLNPVVGILTVLAIILILTLPRDKVIIPFLLAFFTVPFEQGIVVASLHFPVLRILIIAGLIRMAMPLGPKQAPRIAGGWNRIDAVVLLWAFSTLVVLSLQWLDLQAIIKFVGDFLDSCGGYLVARFLIPDRAAVRRTFKALAVVCVVQGICMMSEQYTGHNVFAILGGHNPAFRDGHIRSEGSLGTLFGGTLAGVSIPLFLWLWTEKKSKLAACAGLAGASMMAFSSHASTSWLAYASGLLGLAFWPLRKKMRLVRWGIVATLLGLQMVMHGPVWSLIEKIDVTGGSSSYHRYMLVDNCIRHFSDWWLLGYTNYGSWGFDMWDLCNQFVAVALTGGLVSLILFIAIYSRGFAALGNARKRISGNRRDEFFLWALGATLFANAVASFGINYMIQLQMFLFPLVASISIAALSVQKAPARAAQRATGKAPAFLGAPISTYHPLRELK